MYTYNPTHLEPDILDGQGDGGDGRLGGHHHLQVGGVEAQAEVQDDLFWVWCVGRGRGVGRPPRLYNNTRI
jgi:hypothetical protein